MNYRNVLFIDLFKNCSDLRPTILLTFARMNKGYILIVLVLFTSICFSQKEDDKSVKKEKFPSFFGVQFKPLFPTDFITASELSLKGNELNADYKQKFGFSFGGTVRVGLSKVVNLETGLNFIQRRYHIDYSILSPTVDINASSDFGIIAYDLPVNALFYIKMGKGFYANASLGVSVGYLPSDVWKKEPINAKERFQHEGRRLNKVFGEVNANVGFEYRTKKSGSFYLGSSIKVPFKQLYNIAAVYYADGYTEVLHGKISGSYITLDIRYYFQNSGERSKLRGPIEQ